MSTLGSFIWSIADQLRGPYRPNQYGNWILPLTILRRLDCILEPDRAVARELAAKYDNPNRQRGEPGGVTVFALHGLKLGVVQRERVEPGEPDRL